MQKHCPRAKIRVLDNICIFLMLWFSNTTGVTEMQFFLYT